VTLGAGVSGQAIKLGRRKVLMISAIIGAIGAAISMIESVSAIMTGRIIYGFSVGLIAIGMPRTMEETVPEHTVGTFGGLYCLSFATAVLIAYLLALILPP
jgi:cyanate permease